MLLLVANIGMSELMNIFSLKKFLGTGSFNSLDRRKSLSSMHVTLWSLTQPNLSFAVLFSKFPPKRFCRGLSINVFTEFAGSAIRMFLWLPLPISRSVLTTQGNSETGIWFRDKRSFVQESHWSSHGLAHVSPTVIHQLFVLICFYHLVGCSNDSLQILFCTVKNIVRKIGLTGVSSYFSGGK